MSAKTQIKITPSAVAPAQAADRVAPPQWAVDRVSRKAGTVDRQRHGDLVVEVTDSGDFALATARLVGALGLDGDALERRVTDAYAAIVRGISTLRANRPVRLWNHIPSIHQCMDDRRDRYMVFNAGRYQAFARMYGGPQAFSQEVATASGVGHRGEDLVVHCLSATARGVAVENPRQIPPHRYSEKYGPLPPCFARATVLPESKLILVGGTASIRGEDSLFPASLQLQMSETLTNLASVVEAARAKAGVAAQDDRAGWLGRYRDVRVYFPRPSDAEALEAAARAAFGAACRVEMCRADLCRSELLVEIEGVATLEG